MSMKKSSHAIRLPRLYTVAANVYKDYTEGKDSVKNLVYQAKKKHPNIKAIYALVMEALNHSNVMESAMEKIELFEKEPRFQKALAFVLFTELLFGKKSLPGDSLPITTARKYQKQLKKNLEGVIDLNEERKVVSFPKYARVNSLCNSLTRVCRSLREDGWLEVMYDKQSVGQKEFVKMMGKLKENEFLIDYHINNLIVFPPKTQLYDHPLVQDGSLLLQDKASCMPIAALAPPPGSCVLDSCAAPGMKTSQLASMVCGTWVAVLGGKPPPGAKVYAVERSSRRCQVLREILERSKADKVTTVINRNFLDLDPAEYSDVEYIVVDPSCSGDGMVNRNSMAKDSVSAEKLVELVYYQKKLLRHALTFTSVKQVVYSTCALTREENEGVLEDVLADHQNQWKLSRVLDSWDRRGEGVEYANCVRTDPHQDLCNGFFVSVLERVPDNQQKTELSNGVTENQQNVDSSESTKKKSKKKKRKLEEEEETNGEEKDSTSKINNQKESTEPTEKDSTIQNESQENCDNSEPRTKKSKKKKKKELEEQKDSTVQNEKNCTTENESQQQSSDNSEPVKKKSKKKKRELDEETSVKEKDSTTDIQKGCTPEDANADKPKKKKKKKGSERTD